MQGLLISLLVMVCGAFSSPLDNGIDSDWYVISDSAIPISDSSETAKGVHWALIVAGSNGWYNYRHQADACHAYHVVQRHGIPPERIVLMMYDDIAHNARNPTPGVIINHPNGSDVYGGVVTDYSGEDVTPDNFLAVLQGQSDKVQGIGSGRVIKSGPNDHVFVNFVDHGAPGIIAFPEDELSARQLMTAITNMNEKRLYNQMVFYIEACESGSMFSNLLPTDINVYATTAANPRESSYACYYDAKRETYLGDVYSVMWMEDSDKEDLSKETLKKQYKIVKEETNTSHVMQYGDKTIAKEHVNQFQGGKSKVQPPPIVLPPAPWDAVPSEDVPEAILRRRYQSATSDTERQDIQAELADIQQRKTMVQSVYEKIVDRCSRDNEQKDRLMNRRYELTNYDCYEPVMELFDERCFDLSQEEFALRHLYKLVNACEEQVAVEKIMSAVAEICALFKK